MKIKALLTYPNTFNGNLNNIKLDHSITIIILLFVLLLFSSIQIFAQENEIKKEVGTDKDSKTPNSTQAINDKIEFQNSKGNPIITITDEGFNAGSITLPLSTPGTTTNKLYNEGGILKFNGSSIGSGVVDSLNHLADAIFDGTSLFLGKESGLNDDESFNENTAVGYKSLFSNTSGYFNTSIGYQALLMNTTGRQNTAIGNVALANNQIGIGNSAIGWNSLYSNTAGHGNVAVGYQSLTYNTTGIGNTGVGYSANYFNELGSQNTIIGYEAGKGSSTHNKSGNVFLGFRAGFHETSDNKLYINNDSSASPLIWGDFTDGSEEVRINGDLHVTGNITTDGLGFGAAEINDLTDAVYDGFSLFLGVSAGINNIGPTYNTGIGVQALNSNIDGEFNTAIGLQALLSNTSGINNTANGYQALNLNTTGKYNVGLGNSTNYYNQEGSNNTIIGYEAGRGTSNHSKSGNVFLGYQAGFNETSNDKLYIENSNSSSPLIYGDFAKDDVKINGNLEVTETTQIGNTGVPITEIKLLTGSLSTSSFATVISYPSGYDQSNSFLLSCKVGPPSGSGAIWENVGKFSNGNDRSLQVSFTETDIVIQRENSSTINLDYKMVLMKIE